MFYTHLNQLVDEIEAKLDSKIDYYQIAQHAGLSLSVLQKVFPLIADIPLNDYVRARRLTLAAKDLAQSDYRITDIAFKYGYNSTASFTRAFRKFHGINPSSVKNGAAHIRYFPKLTFTPPDHPPRLEYEIINLPALHLAGLDIWSDHERIKTDAPALFEKVFSEYHYLPHPDYGMLSYESGRDNDDKYHYFVLWNHQNVSDDSSFVAYELPSMRYLKFHIPNQNAKDIQAITSRFYDEFLFTCDYNLRPEPDLEYYHDGTTDFMVPIY